MGASYSYARRRETDGIGSRNAAGVRIAPDQGGIHNLNGVQFINSVPAANQQVYPNLLQPRPERSMTLDEARDEKAFDCRQCGACCGGAFPDVPVRLSDTIRERRPELVVLKPLGWMMRRRDRAGEYGSDCVGLHRDSDGCTCTVYELRPTNCRESASARS